MRNHLEGKDNEYELEQIEIEKWIWNLYCEIETRVTHISKKFGNMIKNTHYNYYCYANHLETTYKN